MSSCSIKVIKTQLNITFLYVRKKNCPPEMIINYCICFVIVAQEFFFDVTAVIILAISIE